MLLPNGTRSYRRSHLVSRSCRPASKCQTGKQPERERASPVKTTPASRRAAHGVATVVSPATPVQILSATASRIAELAVFRQTAAPVSVTATAAIRKTEALAITAAETVGTLASSPAPKRIVWYASCEAGMRVATGGHVSNYRRRRFAAVAPSLTASTRTVCRTGLEHVGGAAMRPAIYAAPGHVFATSGLAAGTTGEEISPQAKRRPKQA